MKTTYKWLCFLGASILLGACSMTPPEFHNVKFLNKSCIEPLKGYNYKTCSPLNVEIDHKKVIVPEGFETDLASIPKWYWPIISPGDSEIMAPSILHDYFYRCNNDHNRKYADSVFYYALKEKGVSEYKAGKFYLAVRMFGEKSFKKDWNCNELYK